MTDRKTLYRSVLYMPGSKARALEKAKALDADALILDLEDAVTPGEKPMARELVCEAVKARGYGRRAVVVRINALDSEWGMDDLKAACAAAPDAILIPKVGSADDLKQVENLMKAFGASDNTRIWAMMEAPLGILNAQEIAASTPMLEAFVLGTNDLFKDLFATHTPERSAVMVSLSMCLLAARAYGLICVDGVYNAFKDDEGLRSECQQGRDMGFDGKTLIHPAQLSVTNEVFAPSAADIALAQSYVDAFNTAAAKGSGVAVVNGKIVENLHVETAQKLLGKAATIATIQ
ncbi:MAG: CoA ester lyase [Paracoccaceae bacterium]